jgi:hypothetical protein
MIFRRILAGGLLLVLVWMSACSPSAAPTQIPTAIPQDETSGTPSLLEDLMRAVEERPGWFSTVLVNAETNTTFRLADFAGRTVYVGFIAAGCGECQTQQDIVRDVQTQLGNSEYIYLSLSVEASDTTAALAQYRAERNYPWIFAAVPPPMLAALVTQFGETISSPTDTPHLVISPDGAISQLATGIESAEQLVGQLTTAAGA